MAVILRWFNYEGHRHREYSKYDEGDTALQSDRRLLVLANREWHTAVPVEPEQRLEDFTEEQLVAMTAERRARTD